MTASALDDIEGVGPKRKKALLKAFGSVKKLRAASAEEIAAVPGIPRDIAEQVAEVLGGGAGGSSAGGDTRGELVDDSLGGNETDTSR
jgi:excinuclease ABC subunit C